MAIKQGLCISARLDFLTGVHEPGDAYVIALYTSVAEISPMTKSFTAKGEVRGAGYEPGGKLLSGWRCGVEGTTAWINWDDPEWVASVTARGAMIYNTTKNYKALAILDFGSEFKSQNGKFKVNLPADGSTATIALGE